MVKCIKLQKFLPYYFEEDDIKILKVYIRENHKRNIENIEN